MRKSVLFSEIIALVAILFGFTAEAQIRKTLFRFPDAGEYKVLKADFHIHTVFSDGVVWPVARVEEAYAEDLDVIAISDHIESRPRFSEKSTDHNLPYDLAKDAAQRYGIVLIHSAEVTRNMPPGHLNAINIQDGNELETFVNQKDLRDSARIVEALTEAKRQGGFIFWNHTAYPTPDNRSTWHPIHQRLLDQGLMMGIEIVNGERYEPIAFQWCLDHNLTILANTDVHSTMAQKRSIDGFKVMTLVLAYDKTRESVMDALQNRRTVALWNNQLIGRKEHVAPIINNSIKAVLHNREGRLFFEYINESGFPFILDIQFLPEGFRIRDDLPMKVNPYETVGYTASMQDKIPTSLSVKALNIWITPTENLELNIPVTYIKH
ncbi:MAG: histidinol-phosphatase [Tannerella sp.]|jgi:hypothetical protein|nr:histidinol-phosphatase [Tannerella sp.]